MWPNYLLPEQYEQDAFIAGGFAACPALARDIDIWIPVAKENVDFAREEILTHLASRQVNFTEEDGQGSPRGKRIADGTLNHDQLLSTFEGYFTKLSIRRVASIEVPGGSLPYHLIVVGGNIDEVLSSFDISTHQVALTHKGVVVGEHWTPVWAEPVVLTQKYTTPERLEKIRQRYAR
mgnify:CR=1 FL=1